MKFSYNWLRELVPGLATGPADLMRAISMKTAECEGVEDVGALLGAASVARVVSFENRVAVVDTERYGAKTVVCGAGNCRPGLLTVYVPVGKKVVHGVESDGMPFGAIWKSLDAFSDDRPLYPHGLLELLREWHRP